MKLRTSALLSLALVMAAAGCRRESRLEFQQAPVIIISVDTLRADHLPAYGYREVETPNIDALRKDSVLFTNAYATVPLTLPSHVSMLTGLLPPDNHVRNNIGYHLDPAMPTLPKTLKQAGYETGAAISAFVLRGNTGMGQAFDFYDDGIVSRPDIPIGVLQRGGADTVAIANRWTGERRQKPFFFLLHLFEPHAPYEPIEPFRSRFRSLYDGEIATADKYLGDFLAQLRRDGTYDKAIVIFMSDHGEGLYQHGEPEHGIFLYREDIHVPLMIKLPGGARGGTTDNRVASLVDLFPTIAQLTRTTAPARLDGRSLFAPDSAGTTRSVYSETLYPRIHLGWSEQRSLVDGNHQFIQSPMPELFDILKDPAETRNVLSEERRVYARMRDELAKYGTAVEGPSRVDPEEAKKLSALGYLGSTASVPAGPLPDPKDRIGELVEMMKAMRFAHENRHAEAVAALRRIVEVNPRLSDAWTQLGESLEILGQYDEAVKIYRKAIVTSPELSSEFGLRLGSVLLKQEKFGEAAEHARLAERLNPAGAHLLLARIAIAEKQFGTAEREAKLAESDKPNAIPAQILLAQVYAQQDRPQQAYAIAEEVRRQAEQQHLGAVESLEFVRGDALARMQRYDEALAALRNEVTAFPRNRNAWSSIYIVYMLTNRPQDAQETLEQMVRANPYPSACRFAARTAEAFDDRATAARWLARAKQLE